MKKILKIILPIFIFFIGFSVSAKGTMFIGNGTVLNQCTGSTCAYPSGGTTNLRFILDPMNFSADSQYTFKLNFSASTSQASPSLTDCGLNINGAYVAPESRNSGRINYECSSNYSRCDSTYASTIIWTSTSSLSSVPVFIQCDMNPSATIYNQTNFTIAVTDSQGSVINAINDNTDRMIETNNYNANENNKNRDANSEMIGGKIDNNTNVIGGKLDIHANTISGKLQQIIDNLTNLGSNIVNAIGTGISNIINKLSDLFVTCHTGKNLLPINSFTSTGAQNILYNYPLVLEPGQYTLSFNSNITTTKDMTIRFTYDDEDYVNVDVFRGTNEKTFILSKKSVLTIWYVREALTLTDVMLEKGSSKTSYEPYQNICKPTILNFFDNFKNFVSNLFSPNTDNANSLGSSEFQNFTTTNVGLRGLLDTLVTFVNNIFNSTCSPLVLPLPFVDNTVTLPCMSGIYTTYFPTFFHIYQLITTGLIAYRVIINLFHKVHQLEDVNYDKVEVLSL